MQRKEGRFIEHFCHFYNYCFYNYCYKTRVDAYKRKYVYTALLYEAVGWLSDQKQSHITKFQQIKEILK
jgi:hypothetical protein